jgi:superfamily II DNA helicase RecQ
MKSPSLSPRLVLIGLASLVSACNFFNNEQTASIPEAPVHTLIFLDKTQSVNINQNFVLAKYRQALNDIVESNMANKGDKLEIYFIHENTSRAKALSLTVHSEKEGLENANATDRETIETTFQMALQREKGIFLRQALTKLNQQNTGTSNQATDIWASLPIIAKAAEDGAQVRVYYFSDMIESVKGADRRDFHRLPPTDDAQAESWAKADAKKMEQYAVGTPEVTVVSPFEPTASIRENNPHVTHYWQTLFQELGGVSLEEM